MNSTSKANNSIYSSQMGSLGDINEAIEDEDESDIQELAENMDL